MLQANLATVVARSLSGTFVPDNVSDSDPDPVNVSVSDSAPAPRRGPGPDGTDLAGDVSYTPIPDTALSGIPDIVDAPAPDQDSNPDSPVNVDGATYYRLKGGLYGGSFDGPAYLRVVNGMVIRLDAATGESEGGELSWEMPQWLQEAIDDGMVVPFDPDNVNDWLPITGLDGSDPYVITTAGRHTPVPPAMIKRLPALAAALGCLPQVVA